MLPPRLKVPVPVKQPVGVVQIPGRPYYADFGTNNKSFTKVSAHLAEKGIKNNAFMLALYDLDLVGVDPHREDLPEEIQARILVEITRNPFYFIREVVRIPVPGGWVPYELHLGNLFLTWAMVSNLNCYLLLPRQNYKTVSACAIYLWQYGFSTTNSHMLFFNKELKDSQNNLKRVKDIQDNLPNWLRENVLDHDSDRNAIEYIYSENRKNRIDPKAAGTSTEHADKLGRGNTVPSVWYDEIAFMKFIRETYMAAVPAQSQARASAIKMGVPFGTVITTTPNSQDDPSGMFAYMIRNGSLRFRLEFYDYGPTKVRQMMEELAEYNYLYAEYTYKELGRSEAWFKEQCRELLNDQMKIKREILLVWPISTEGAVFDENQLENLRKHQKPVVATLPVKLRHAHIQPGLEVEFTEMPDTVLPYLLTVDTSGGVGRDYTAFNLLHPDDMRIIGTLKTNTADDGAVRALTEHFMTSLFPRCIAVIERNYLGIVVINHLLKVPGLEPRIFYLEKEREAERTIGKMVVKQKKRVRVYGVDTTAESREAMFRHLFQIVDELPHLIRAEDLQDEIRTLHRKKTGKIEARAGFHDDVLMSFLIGIYADRHDQPVLRGMISRGRQGGERNASQMNAVSALNIVGDRPAVPVALTGKKEVSVDDYVARADHAMTDEKAAKRARMASILNDLNSSGSGGDFPM